MAQILSLHRENMYDYEVRFQGKTLNLLDLDSYYHKQIEILHNNNLGVEIEVLPSIYYKKIANFHPRQKITREDRFFSKMRKAIHNHFYDKQIYEITISAKNIRDQFKFFSADKMNLSEEGYYKKRDIKVDKLTYLNPQVLPYPTTLGGGPNRCDIWNFLCSIDMVNTYSEMYEILPVRKMFEVTAHDPNMLEVCENSKHCGPIIKKMKEGRYTPGFEGAHDDIEAQVVDGANYYVYEGKHRTCMAKRFNIPEIPVLLTYSETDKREWMPNKVKPLKNIHVNGEVNCENILTACYDRFKKIGLTREDVRELNESILDSEYVAFIERKAGKKLPEIVVKKEKTLF